MRKSLVSPDNRNVKPPALVHPELIIQEHEQHDRTGALDLSPVTSYRLIPTLRSSPACERRHHRIGTGWVDRCDRYRTGRICPSPH